MNDWYSRLAQAVPVPKVSALQVAVVVLKIVKYCTVSLLQSRKTGVHSLCRNVLLMRSNWDDADYSLEEPLPDSQLAEEVQQDDGRTTTALCQ